MIRPREVRQVEGRVAIRIAGAESADQFALCRWHVPKAVAVGIRQSAVAAGRVGIEVVEGAGVGVKCERGRKATVCISVGRRTTRSARTCRGCLRGGAATISTAGATAASVVPRALANHVGFHGDWAGRTM
jgi:hypothetical protein